MEAQEDVVLGNLKTWEIPKAKGIQLILMKQGPGNEGREACENRRQGGNWQGAPGEEGDGMGHRSLWRGLVAPRARHIRSWACAS